MVANAIYKYLDFEESEPTPSTEQVRCRDCKFWEMFPDRNGLCNCAANNGSYDTNHLKPTGHAAYEGLFMTAPDFGCVNAEPK